MYATALGAAAATTQDLVDRVTAQYRADVAEIAVLPGVEFVLP